MAEVKKKKYSKTIVIDIEYEMWASLRKIAYEREITMADITRAALEKTINRYEKAS